MKNYNRLKEIQTKYPTLTFDNDGYEYIFKEKEKLKDVVSEIESILKEEIEGFVRFDNFKPRKDGSFAVRCQYKWDSSFIGVGYFGIEEFKD